MLPSLQKLCRTAKTLLETPKKWLAALVALPVVACALPAVAQSAETAAQAAPDPTVSWWQAIILGLVQGLTEFIPVSSSAHLNIAHHFMGHDRELTFDVFLHVGTVAALVFYFRHDWKELLFNRAQRKMLGYILLACVPAAIVGFATREWQDTHPLFKDPRSNAIMLIVGGALLLLADKISAKKREIKDVSAKDAVLVGIGQACALIPGVSRSGATLTAGLFLGFKREDAMRFSFLMSLPIMLGAFAFEFRGLLEEGGLTSMDASPFAVFLGILASALSGLWAIAFLLNYLKTRDVTPFFVWRVVVAILVFALLAR